MIKRLILLFLLLTSPIYAAEPIILARSNPYVLGTLRPATNTNYCNDANAQLCLYMNGNGTDETDRSANGYTITDSATSPATSSTVPSGYSGTSRLFVASSSEFLNCTEANCPNLDINGASQTVTVTAWINVSTARANAALCLIAGKYYSTSNDRQYGLFYTGTGNSQFKATFCKSASYSAGTSSSCIDSSTTTYAQGTWYHFAGVYDGSYIRIYVNGSEAQTAVSNTGGIYNSAHDFTVASDHYGYFDGYIDEVAVFNRALSATEIADIYNNGLTGNKGGND